MHATVSWVHLNGTLLIPFHVKRCFIIVAIMKCSVVLFLSPTLLSQVWEADYRPTSPIAQDTTITGSLFHAFFRKAAIPAETQTGQVEIKVAYG